jgi:hypothetical protein
MNDKRPAPSADISDTEAWRSRGEPVAVRVMLVLDEAGRADVYIHQLDARERMLRALKVWGICWGLSLASVLVPVMHFVLVPGFFLAGPLAGWLAHRRTESLLGGQVQCPKCQRRFDIGAGGVVWPLQAPCPGCRTVLRLAPVQTGESTE